MKMKMYIENVQFGIIHPVCIYMAMPTLDNAVYKSYLKQL